MKTLITYSIFAFLSSTQAFAVTQMNCQNKSGEFVTIKINKNVAELKYTTQQNPYEDHLYLGLKVSVSVLTVSPHARIVSLKDQNKKTIFTLSDNNVDYSADHDTDGYTLTGRAYLKGVSKSEFVCASAPAHLRY